MTQHLKKTSIQTITELFQLQEIDCDTKEYIYTKKKFTGFLYPNYPASSICAYNQACLEIRFYIYITENKSTLSYHFEAVIASIDDSSVAILGPKDSNFDKALVRLEKFKKFIESLTLRCPSDEELNTIAQQIGCYVNW